MQLGITIPLQKYLNLPKQSYGEPEDLFFCWEIHRILYQGRDMMIAVNANNRFGVALAGITVSDWKRLPELVEEAVEKGMCDEGYSSEQIDAYFNIAGPAMLTKTHGRKSVAGLNRAIDYLYHIPGTVTEQQRLQVLHCRQMNRDICSPSGFDVYGEPQEFFRKDMVRIGIISHFDKKQFSI